MTEQAGQRPPLVGISGRRWPVRLIADLVPKAMHDAEFDLHYTEYGKAVAIAGGLPVELTRDAPVDELVDRLDGLVLSGGADVDPRFYGAPPDPDLGATEPDRDEWELALVDAAFARAVPVLAICRGLQLVNVHFGGTLVQHVDVGDGDGHPRFDDPRHHRAHRVALAPGSLAARVYGGAHDVSDVELEVNSLHHQVVGDLGNGLVATGSSPDGTIEVVERPGCALLGLQWHPEALGGTDRSFQWLVSTAGARAARR